MSGGPRSARGPSGPRRSGRGGGSRRLTAWLLAAVAGLLLVSVLADRPGHEGRASQPFRPAFDLAPLHPSFHPAARRYVARCGPRDRPLRARVGAGTAVSVGGGPARRGDFLLRGAAAHGDDFRFAVEWRGRRRAYSVRCLPANFPRWRFERLRPGAEGLFVVSLAPTATSPQWIVVFDDRGTPRWWLRPGARVLWSQILRDGTVSWARSFGDGYGQRPQMAHEIRTLSGRLVRLVRTRGSIIDGHELRETGGGRVLVGAYTPHREDLSRMGGPRRAGVVTAEVQELDRRGRVLWRWNSRGRLRLGETRLRWWARVLANPRRRLGVSTFDPVHLNAIEPRGRGEVVVSARHLDAVYGIDRATGHVRWKLGGRGRASGLRVVGDPAPRRFGGQHDVRLADDGSLSVYDNGKLRSYPPRVAFYRLRLGRGEARFLGQLRDPLVRSSHCCGSARQLADGGWLVSWGDNPLVSGFDRRHRLAYRLRLPVPSYRAVPVPEGAVTLAELDQGLERMLRRR